MSERRFDPGDLIEWQGLPLIVASIAKRGGPHESGGYDDIACCVYLRGHGSRPGGYQPIQAGDVKPKFHLYAKTLWSGDLTDEEQALAMRHLLVGTTTEPPPAAPFVKEP